MHHIYHTKGIILDSRNFGEAGKRYTIFTRDLGLVYASAQGVRKMSSKLRYILQDFSYVKIDLVRGANFWRVTSATKTGKLEALSKNPETFTIFANIARLLKRLLAGEYPNVDLFADVLRGLALLERAAKEDLPNIEAVIVLRTLGNLGYIGGSAKLENLVKSPFADELVAEAYKYRKEILSQINKAMKETHL